MQNSQEVRLGSEELSREMFKDYLDDVALEIGNNKQLYLVHAC